jgi:hypothetical protein
MMWYRDWCNCNEITITNCHSEQNEESLKALLVQLSVLNGSFVKTQDDNKEH